MESLWDEKTAATFADDALQMRVYSSRLLGCEPSLVLHGGGNTSVKATATNLFGEQEELLYVKGSGWDLATIEAAGFAPVRMRTLRQMAELESLSDADMVRLQRSAMTDPNAPNPSVEAILHALIPFTYVDHTHADAVVTISNTPTGAERIAELYGERVLVVPYVMPGFVLAKAIAELTGSVDWSKLEGIVLLNHGLFTFADDARTSYEKMIELVSMAEAYLDRHAGLASIPGKIEPEQLVQLAGLRRAVSRVRGRAVLASLDDSPDAVAFSGLENVASLTGRGPLTPDHVIRTKRTALIVDEDVDAAVDAYATDYRGYFDKHTDGTLQCLDAAPRWGVWPGHGVLGFDTSEKNSGIILDIARHTCSAIRRAEALGGWQALPERDIFELEYWELEQAKLKKGGTAPMFTGKIALVTGAASGIGLACVEALLAYGAVVAAIDINPAMHDMFSGKPVLAIDCDVTDSATLSAAVAATVRRFGGLDIVISNAGLFTASQPVEQMDAGAWEKSLQLNLTSHQQLLSSSVPFLKRGIDPAVVIMASKNVPAPGPGAAAYSVAKAGLTQLARVAALELGEYGIRVNTLHPNAVFDTAIWTPEVLAKRAASYGLSVDEYKTNNVLKVEVTSRDVAELACQLAGPAFARTTGAQIPVDGGNERVI